MLARLEAHVAEQRRFAANASHELRTPLAITQALLDVARQDPTHDQVELLDRLHAVNARAIDLTEALLLLSRADQRSFSRERVDLSLLAEEATETLLPLAEKRGVTLETSGDVTPAVGSRALLLQMTTNLVHNAIVHNLPAGGTVRVRTAALTGVGRAHRREHRRAARSRGWSRRSPSRSSAAPRACTTDHAGVGLGLAIVESIVRAHDGHLTLTPRDGGGLRVVVRLPAAPRSGPTGDARPTRGRRSHRHACARASS